VITGWNISAIAGEAIKMKYEAAHYTLSLDCRSHVSPPRLGM
jgi:hypothetical protein